MTIPDSAVNVLAGSESVSTVRRVFDRGLGADSVLLRMLWADSRSETSPQRVGCGISRHHSGKNARGAPQRAGWRAPLSRPRPNFVKVEPSSRFAPYGGKKRSCYDWPRGFETSKISKETNSSLRPRSFSRTIPVRTPQSASRTEESKVWMSQPGGLTPGRT